ncbi:soluble NSF attachment protein [Jimgerdemannia flammicorona]|uniref:Gamma-soluble NSF attachment protein n=1 Tax=Jimgerdemannia flammicorona TaxID=994334 RepID=A0A433AHX8_9FUNG|nr:soluble NSF attachment protein [Jimgerdemannia flammicorona]
MSAKDMETAAQILAQNMNQPERAADSYRRASDLYVAHGSADRAAEMLEKAAKNLESTDINAAIELYSSSCSMYESEDRGRFAIGTFERAIGLMVKNKRYEKAIDMLQRLGTIQGTLVSRGALYKTNLSILIIYLEMGDEVEAGKQFQNFCVRDSGFPQSEEASICHGLLDAFEQGDQDLLDQTVARQNITFLDNDIARLARQLKVPGESLTGGGGLGATSLSPAVGASYKQTYVTPSPMPSRTPYPPRQPISSGAPVQTLGYPAPSRAGDPPSPQPREHDRAPQQALSPPVTDRLPAQQPTSPTQHSRGYDHDTQQEQSRYNDRGRAPPPQQEYGRPPSSPQQDYGRPAPSSRQDYDRDLAMQQQYDHGYDNDRQQGGYHQPQQRPTPPGVYHQYQPQLRERSPGSESIPVGRDQSPGPAPAFVGRDRSPAPGPTLGGRDRSPGPGPTVFGRDRSPGPGLTPVGRHQSPIPGPGPRGPAPSARDPRPQPQNQVPRGGSSGYTPQQHGRRPEEDYYERERALYQQPREHSPVPPASRQQAPPVREYAARDPQPDQSVQEEEEYKFEWLADSMAPLPSSASSHQNAKPPASALSDEEGGGYDYGDYLDEHFDALSVNDEREEHGRGRQPPQHLQGRQAPQAQSYRPQADSSSRDQHQQRRRYDEDEDGLR